mgnify:CR=1 FL=1
MENKQQSKTAGLIGFAEAATYIGKTTKAMRGNYKRYGVPFIKIGGQIKFTYALLDEWIKSNTVTK